MKKILAIAVFSLSFLLCSVSSYAQAKELNSTSADTLTYHFKVSKSAKASSGVIDYVIPIDTLLKVATKQSLPKMVLQTGTNKGFNTTTLVSGTKTITNSAITSSSKLIVFLITPSGTLAHNYSAPTANISAGTAVINGYQSNATVQTEDNSVVGYIIVN